MALKIEYKFNKKEIIALYLNRVDFGSNTFGVSAAAYKFFDKPAKELTIFESAMLVGVLKATSTYSPIHSFEKSLERTKVVLKLMMEAGYIDDYKKYLNSYNNRTSEKKDFEPKYFSDWVLTTISIFVGKIDKDLVVLTTFDSNIQKICEESIQKIFTSLSNKLKISQVAMVVMDHDGAVLSMIGGMNYKQSQFNRVTQALRPPGSAFKTFVYLGALESGMTTDTLIDDSPYEKEIYGKIWKLSNFKWQSMGEIPLILAFSKSVNSIPPKICDIIGFDKIIEIARRLGLSQTFKEDPSIVIGTAETTLLELTGAYATFANGGYSVWPYSIIEIRNSAGDILYEKENNNSKKIIEDNIVIQMQELLKEVVLNGTGRNSKPCVGGKTGSNANKDAWFIGYDDNYVVGIWCGNDDNSDMHRSSTGSNMPAKIASEFFKNAKKIQVEN